MLSIVLAALLVLWVAGIATANTMGGLVHVLLVMAVVVFLIRVSQGRSPLRRG